MVGPPRRLTAGLCQGRPGLSCAPYQGRPLASGYGTGKPGGMISSRAPRPPDAGRLI